jgi:hypothetical protein
MFANKIGINRIGSRHVLFAGYCNEHAAAVIWKLRMRRLHLNCKNKQQNGDRTRDVVAR